jgi:hypothetical protein
LMIPGLWNKSKYYSITPMSFFLGAKGSWLGLPNNSKLTFYGALCLTMSSALISCFMLEQPSGRSHYYSCFQFLEIGLVKEDKYNVIPKYSSIQLLLLKLNHCHGLIKYTKAKLYYIIHIMWEDVFIFD